MKILLGLSFVFAPAFNSFAMPLVFKTTKEIKANEAKDYLEIASLDTTKCKQMRIALIYSGTIAQSAVHDVPVEAIESDDVFPLSSLRFGFNVFKTSVEINNPPSKLRFSANQTGIYKIFVWAN